MVVAIRNMSKAGKAFLDSSLITMAEQQVSVQAEVLTLFQQSAFLSRVEDLFSVIIHVKPHCHLIRLESLSPASLSSVLAYVKLMEQSVDNAKHSALEWNESKVRELCEAYRFPLHLLADLQADKAFLSLHALWDFLASMKRNDFVKQHFHKQSSAATTTANPTNFTGGPRAITKSEIPMRDMLKKPKPVLHSSGVTASYDMQIAINNQRKKIMKTPAKRLRPVIIDGQNVAYHLEMSKFNTKAIVYAVEYFRKRGHDHITVIVPKSLSFYSELQDLERRNLLRFVPARKIGDQKQTSHDDCCIIETAMQVDGVILSNDNFRLEMESHPEIKTFVEERLLLYYFSGKELIIPQYVHGPNKPTRDEILCFPSTEARGLAPSSSDTEWMRLMRTHTQSETASRSSTNTRPFVKKVF